MVRVHPRTHFNSVLDQTEGADLLGVGLVFRISGAGQFSHDSTAVIFVPRMQCAGPGVDFGSIAENLAAHAAVYNALIFDVEKGKDAHPDGSYDQEGDQSDFYDGSREGRAPIALAFFRFRVPVFSAARVGFSF